jgi:hypothetical protein
VTTAPLPARVARRVVRVLGSFHLACIVLSLLFVVVLIGTVAQISMSIYDVQRAYFIPAFFVIRLFGFVPLPLPGGALLLAVLVANLVVGGILRMRWGKSTLGILIAHLGIVTLLVGSAIEYARSDKGLTRQLFASDRTDMFESSEEWELAISDLGAAKEFVVPQDVLEEAEGRRTRRVTAAQLPFDVKLSGWIRNAAPERSPDADTGAEGFLLRAQPPDPKQAGANSPGVYADLLDRSGKSVARGILWGFSRAPFTANIGSSTYVVELRRRRWLLPFRVEVDRIVGRMHPGTSMASEYSSYVRHLEGGVATDSHITMNAPLRHRGYTLYQSGYGVEPGRGPWTVFAVVRNPTDRLPIAACAVIAVGLAMHFIRKLTRYLRARAASRATTPAGAAAAGSAA